LQVVPSTCNEADVANYYGHLECDWGSYILSCTWFGASSGTLGAACTDIGEGWHYSTIYYPSCGAVGNNNGQLVCE
jgi:hypothetical protein